MAKGIPNLIASSIVNGLRSSLNWNETQAFISIKPVLDMGWQGMVQAQVVLMGEKPYKGGRGQQEGGGLMRTRDVDIAVFYRMNLDVHGESSELLTREATGLSDLIETIRGIFEFTYLDYHPNQTISEYLLLEPMFLKNISDPVWEDEENGIARQTITYETNYGQGSFASNLSLTPQQIQSF